MENRFGLEDVSECQNCGEETLCETFCPACADSRYDEREAMEDAAEGDSEPMRYAEPLDPRF